jgi:hypothetical protein
MRAFVTLGSLENGRQSDMSVDLATWGHLEKLTWQHVLLALAVLVAARLLSFLLRGLLRRVAESAAPHLYRAT